MLQRPEFVKVKCPEGQNPERITAMRARIRTMRARIHKEQMTSSPESIKDKCSKGLNDNQKLDIFILQLCISSHKKIYQ